MKKFLIASIFCVLLQPTLLQALTIQLNECNEALGIGEGNFVTATVTVSGTTATFIVDPNDALLNPDRDNPNYGLQAFAFMTSFDSEQLQESDFSLSAGWTVAIEPNNNFSEFGKFEIATDTTGASRQNPLKFTITNSLITSDVVFNVQNSAGYTMAAHVADIGPFQNGSITSAWFADGVSVPDASMLLLLGSGLVTLGVFRRKFK